MEQRLFLSVGQQGPQSSPFELTYVETFEFIGHSSLTLLLLLTVDYCLILPALRIKSKEDFKITFVRQEQRLA
jgi:hypothetical protein